MNEEEEEIFENHDDTTIRSGGEIEKPKEVEQVVKELDEHVENEEESASPKLEERNEEVGTIPEMTCWEYVHEEFPIENMPYILEVEEIILSLHEFEKTSIMKKVFKSCEEYVLKLVMSTTTP